ncbi:unnamed protein product [Orchesella dallaii]|uniref:EGF-like domain-containing protein n=1 Tax=Orchesella dallaii TaxID=48710 RepID=A0ABP1PSU1_9HEXA
MKFMIKLVMISLMALDWLTSPGTGLTVARIDPKLVGGSLKCSESEFQCVNPQHCIPSRWKCDGENDCLDGSDEDPQLCKTGSRTCLDSDFACSRSLCIPKAWVCDDSPDCPDARDEADCHNATCTSAEFTCKNGKCIVKHWVCDGNNDCTDNSDEEHCPPRTCTPGKDFMCKNDSSCILATWRCDGEYDCADGSDEKGCTSDHANVTSRCGKQEFECGDRITCIHNSWVCDNDQDCPEGSDEDEVHCQHVNCRPDQFQCRSLECIPGHLQCSGSPECTDESDEENCSLYGALGNNTRVIGSGCDRKTEFDCGSSCIPLDKVCDQKNDCGNWADEPKDKCGVNECAVANGGCSELCVDTAAGFYCECRPGFKLFGNSSCEDIDECTIPGTCSQICTNEKGSFKCECMEGYLRDPKDHTRCKAVEGHASLLFALRHDIRKISLDHLKMTQIVESTRSACALDYMFRTGMIFWSDGHDGKIYKAPIDEGNAKNVVIEDGLSNSDGLAIDWIYNHIYWTDSGRKVIAVAELDGKMRKTLIKDDLVEPRSIAVNPIDGWMYWTDWGVTPGRIERAGMDGSHREILVNTNLKWPNGLTLDMVQGRIYWVDAKLNSISSCNFDGTSRRLILQSPEALAHPFSITTFEDYVYWTDWTNETIFKANKFTGKEVTPLLPPNTVKHVMSVHVYHAYRQPDGENHCTPLNGRCSHLCLPAPRINARSAPIACACPDGTILTEDGQNCAPDPGYNKQQTNEHYARSGLSGPDAGTVAGIVIGVLSALLVLVIIVVLLLYRRIFLKHENSMNFDNPVYRKTTTEDHGGHISIEKTRGYHKTYPATISEEAQEPLNNVGANDYA